MLGAIDNLLTSLVTDNMTRTRHHSNRELIGQGMGNTIAGFFGGIPGAGATMRTVVNIRTIGVTKISECCTAVATGCCSRAGTVGIKSSCSAGNSRQSRLRHHRYLRLMRAPAGFFDGLMVMVLASFC